MNRFTPTDFIPALVGLKQDGERISTFDGRSNEHLAHVSQYRHDVSITLTLMFEAARA